jgi:hypothetical protein
MYSGNEDMSTFSSPSPSLPIDLLLPRDALSSCTDKALWVR